MIELVSYGVNRGSPPPGPANFEVDCRLLPDPSKTVFSVPGTDARVGSVVRAMNPLVDSWLEYVAEVIHRDYESAGLPVYRVHVACSQGYHRAPFVVEQLWRLLTDRGDECAVTHFELSGLRDAEGGGGLW